MSLPRRMHLLLPRGLHFSSCVVFMFEIMWARYQGYYLF
jgi:hypothetical protein